MPHATNRVVNADIPYITQEGDSQIITNIKAGTMIGFKYFAFEGKDNLSVKFRGSCEGTLTVSICETEAGCIHLSPSDEWQFRAPLSFSAEGV